VFQRYTQRGERGPQANGGKRVQIGFHGSILDVRVFARRSEPEGLLGIFENLNAPAVSTGRASQGTIVTLIVIFIVIYNVI
jgi:hypothetical protein